MGFNSFRFILLFLPILLAGWYFLNRYTKNAVADVFLTLMSLYFYYTFGASFLPVLILSLAVNYALSICMDKLGEKGRRNLKVLGVLFNLGLLFYCKYLGFFTENLNALLSMDLTFKQIYMPIGISFFTFGQISYIVDRANGRSPRYSFLEYAMYTVYFPKLIQGPIAFHEEIISQFRDESKRSFNFDNFAKGMASFIIGLGKKVLLADNLAKAVNYGFEQTYYLDTITVIVVMLAYTFQIYLDFSGYCDMANGVSLMLNIELPMNFNSPYKAASAKELWQRWHMTLSRFFIKYVYIPLGGSRKGKIRTVINVLIVFILSGLWHGAGWTYICWGLMQGLLVVWDDIGIVGIKGDSRKKYLFREKPLITIHRAIGNAMTFIMFIVSLVFFRSKDLASAFAMFKRLFFWTYPGFLHRTVSKLSMAENYVPRQLFSQLGMNADTPIYMITMAIMLIVCAVLTSRKNTKEMLEDGIFTKKAVIGLSLVFIWSFISLSEVSTFIYFQY